MSNSKRKFIKQASLVGGGLMFGDVFRLFQGIQQGIFNQAMADVTGTLSKAYINYHMRNAPARWLFDQWLTPNLTDEILSPSNAATWNNGFATGFNSNQYDYKLWTYNGVQVPHTYSHMVSGSGGQRPFSDLLRNMAVIRGYNSSSDGHEINSPLQTFPDPAAPSLSGLAADNRNDLIAAVAPNFATHPFKSQRNRTLASINNHPTLGGSAYGLMKAFKSTSTSKQGILTIDEITTLINELHDVANAQACQLNSRSNVIKEHLKNARDLTLLAADDLNTIWAGIYGKYQTLAQDSIRSTLTNTGFSENPILFSGSETRNFSYSGGSLNVDASYDLRQCLNSARANTNMLRSFALAEYCLTRQITGSLILGSSDHLYDVELVKTGDTAATKVNSVNDQHDTPTRLGVLLNAGFFRGFGASLLELIDVMKGITTSSGENLFNSSVIHVTGDFARSPRNDMAGSDHGWDGQVTSVFSGAIDGPVITGNIAAHGRSGYVGSWGMAAPVSFNGASETLSPRHVAAAIAHLLGSTNPWSFTNRVWDLGSNGKIVAKIGAKVV
jgi:hypothetical protein